MTAPISSTIGYTLAFLDKAMKGGSAFWHCENDPVIKRIESSRAWAKFQAEVRSQRADRRGRHGPIRDINKRQRDTVHNALRGVR